MIGRRLAEPWARAGFPWAVLDTRELLLIGADLVRAYSIYPCDDDVGNVTAYLISNSASQQPPAAMVPSAISNAVFDAIGVRPCSVPFTPDKV